MQPEKTETGSVASGLVFLYDLRVFYRRFPFREKCSDASDNLFLKLPRGGKSKKPFELLDFFAKKSYNKA